MTNNEILHASALDILFDGRNKEYGAYALRRDYNQRLLLALGSGLSLILLFMLVGRLNKNESVLPVDRPARDSVKIISVEIPVSSKQKEKLSSVKSVPPKSSRQVATIKYTTPRMVEDVKNTRIPEISEIDNNNIGAEDKKGQQPDGIVPPGPPAADTGNGPGAAEVPLQPPKPSSAPQFPGGMGALREFMARNLVTPDDLEPGEKKIVKARFFVDEDGSVSTIEIEISGGKVFDKEVIRVCKKMPKWKPAMQDGMPVRIGYVLPVTFIAVEQ